jgi:hypothetical protein
MIDFEKDVFNLSEGMDSEVKLNPDFYIHTSLVASQYALLLSTKEGNVSNGINAYYIYAKQVLMFAESAGYLSSNTLEEIKKLKESDVGKSKDTADKALMATQIIGIVMSEIFKNKPQYASLVLDSKKLTSVDFDNNIEVVDNEAFDPEKETGKMLDIDEE